MFLRGLVLSSVSRIPDASSATSQQRAESRWSPCFSALSPLRRFSPLNRSSGCSMRAAQR